jgi:uncharacterized protein (TIGR00369 family)
VSGVDAVRLESVAADDLAALLSHAFEDIPLHGFLGLSPRTLDPEVVIEMPLRESAGGLTGGLHGGAIATLVDVATNCAAAMSDQFELGVNEMVTLDLHLRFLRRPAAGPITARAVLVHEGSRIMQVDVGVFDGGGDQIANSTGFVILSNPRESDAGESIDSARVAATSSGSAPM